MTEQSSEAKRPFIIRRDDTLADRETGQIIGRVWLDEGGWVAESLWHTFGPYRARHVSARRAWDDWRRIVLAADATARAYE